VHSRKGDTVVAGSLLAEGYPRIVRIDGFHVDMNPRGTIVVIRNRDVPGVIGRVGTALGDAGINIAEYHQARLQAGGQALAAVSVDSRLGADVLARLREFPEILDVKQADLD
jgi:D-3-phosphoglycerate dehydrogenase